MANWIVIEITDEGKVRMLNGEYETRAEAEEAKEAMEWLHDENDYRVMTNDEWMYEVENGGV